LRPTPASLPRSASSRRTTTAAAARHRQEPQLASVDLKASFKVARSRKNRRQARRCNSDGYSLSTFRPRQSATQPIPYSLAALPQDLQPTTGARRLGGVPIQPGPQCDLRVSRPRVRPRGLVGSGGTGRSLSSPGSALAAVEVFDREDAFPALIRGTADPAKADKRTRSKWSRVMRYAAV
jgi:hypothetical protein